MSFRWSQHFPYSAPREIQAQALQILEDEWDNYDVFVMSAPTAFGKTAVAKCIMNSLYSVSVITPTNMLVDQFLDEFPDTPTLSRMDSYFCEEWQRPCTVTRNKLMKFCKGCKCGSEVATAKFRRGPGIYNYHTYLAHKLHRNVLVVDEAHNLIPVIRDRLAQTIWQHDYKYPYNMWTPDQILTWISKLPENKQRHKKIQLLRESAGRIKPEYVIERTTQMFAGKGTIRGQPEERDCIRLLPVDISGAPAMFWGGVQKTILLSATISKKDIEALGIRGRVCYVDCKSPIPARARPIIPLDLVGINRQNMEEAVPLLAQEIRQIAAHHAGEKGVIHATYELARMLEVHLGDDQRFVFHDRDNKKEQYQGFRESKYDDVLVACGMYEGMDLPEDLGRWQVIAKIPWPSLASPAIAHLADKDPEFYIWECLKSTIQACGRICRTPEDFGVTYILDSTFWRMIDKGEHLIPQWYLEAIETPNK